MSDAPAPESPLPADRAAYLTRPVVLGAALAIVWIAVLGSLKSLGEASASWGPTALLWSWAALAALSLRPGSLGPPLLIAQTGAVCVGFGLFDPVAHGTIGMFLLNTGLVAFLLPGAPAAAIAGTQTAVSMALLWHLQWPITLEYPAPWLLQPALVGFGAGWALRRSALARVQVARLAAHLSRMNDVLEENLRTSQALAAARERTRIARELHDRLGHCLTTTHVYLQVAQRDVTHDSPVAEALSNAAAMTRHGLAELRSCVALLREPESDRPLADAIRALVQRVPSSVLDAHFAVSGSARTLPSVARFALLRTAQEGLTNVLRHAQASAVNLELAFKPDRVTLTVMDDGLGCEAPRPGAGLTGVRDRLEELGGSLQLETSAGRGYRLRAELVAP